MQVFPTIFRIDYLGGVMHARLT